MQILNYNLKKIFSDITPPCINHIMENLNDKAGAHDKDKDTDREIMQNDCNQELNYKEKERRIDVEVDNLREEKDKSKTQGKKNENGKKQQVQKKRKLTTQNVIEKEGEKRKAKIACTNVELQLKSRLRRTSRNSKPKNDPNFWYQPQSRV